MAKLKRLAHSSDNIVSFMDPLSSEELLDRQLDYPLLHPRRFARKYNKLFDPIEFTYKGEDHTLQFNYCTNPYCSWFGLSQKKFEEIKNKPSRYKLSSRGKDKDDTIVCNLDPTEKTKSHKCTVTPLSNWSVIEEIKRLATLDKVEDIKPEYNFHKDD
ncbi:hypothetical protein [Bacillus pseudomycoides]|uniref:hypothetical protein n=1 Tax=Bacillus pseudomycoides TaxID=64104 RepID=UPI001FB56711|nr:hypothetical protein [Bacillus pseudomycoides]